MSIAPGGVIRALYPKVGHEAALGLDLLDHPERKQNAQQTIQTKRTFVAGPVSLEEGDIAFISYTQISTRHNRPPHFWESPTL